MLPRIARVRVEAARDRVVVVLDVTLPRGEWQGASLDPYVAFGSPGTPIAVDARLLPAARDPSEGRPDDVGEVVPIESAVRRGPGSPAFLGPPQMAGVVLRIKDMALRRAFASGDLATLRIRSLLRAPNVNAEGMRALVIRLGIPGGPPLTIGRIQLASLETEPWITRADATLCGPEADPWPLSITLLPRPVRSFANGSSIAPELAVRHASDDLCIRFWTERR